MNDVEISVPPPCSPPIIPPATPTETPPRLPWGFWATTGFGVALISIYVFAQSIVTVGYMVIEALWHHGKISLKLEEVAMDGDVLGIAVILGAPVVILFAGLFIKLRHGPALVNYLGLNWPRWRAVILWSLGMAAVLISGEVLTMLINRPVVPDVMIDVYRTADFKPVLWLAIIILGPAVEEIIFRGFLFHGWKESRLGSWGTIVLTAASWAIIHLQYDFYGIATIFAYGIFLGLVRLRTGSVLLCTGLHCALNLIATIQAELYLAKA